MTAKNVRQKYIYLIILPAQYFKHINLVDFDLNYATFGLVIDGLNTYCTNRTQLINTQ